MNSPTGGPALVHSIRLQHAVTTQALSWMRGHLVEPIWENWILDHRKNHVLLISKTDDWEKMPAVTNIAFTMRNRQWAGLLENEGRLGPKELSISLGSPGEIQNHVFDVAPSAMQLELHLVDEFGKPIVGAKVQVMSRNDGGAIELRETPKDNFGSGVYRSARQVWDSRYYPFSIHVNEVRVAYRHMSYQNRVTRYRIVTPKHLIEQE